MLNRLILTILTAAILTLAGATTSVAGSGVVCGDGTGMCIGSSDRNEHGHGREAGNGNKGGDCIADEVDDGSVTTYLTTEEIDWLMFIREEEKLARDSYLVLGNLWGLVIFENIAASEQKHMDAMKKLIECYKLTDPVIDEIGSFSDSELQALFDFLMAQGAQSTMDGLYVGATIEETDIDSIQTAIEVTDQMHIVSTYESLMCGSRNHLRAFIRQIEINGGSYTPKVLEEKEFWAIAYSEMEQGCGGNKRGKGKR